MTAKPILFQRLGDRRSRLFFGLGHERDLQAGHGSSRDDERLGGNLHALPRETGGHSIGAVFQAEVEGAVSAGDRGSGEGSGGVSLEAAPAAGSPVCRNARPATAVTGGKSRSTMADPVSSQRGSPVSAVIDASVLVAAPSDGGAEGAWAEEIVGAGGLVAPQVPAI
jgi:hypothetical protein